MTTANCSLADNTLILNTALINAVTIDPDPTNNLAAATTTAKKPPPAITCPADRDVIAPMPGSVSAIVTYPNPAVTDNCPGVIVVCSPASGTPFPLGLTTVTCTATDSGGATASGSFKVTVWDVAIQDDASRDFVLFNSFNGDYKFVHCGVDGFIMIGRGAISRVGCITKLTDDSRVISAEFDRCPIAPSNRGSASYKHPRIGTTFPMKDGNILNNTPTCPSGNPI